MKNRAVIACSLLLGIILSRPVSLPADPYIPTLAHPLPSGVLTAPFGNRINPLTARPEHHSGIDLAAEKGTPIAAAADGIVTFSGMADSYGNCIRIAHNDRSATLYAHCSRLLVPAGESVSQGDHIALTGDTGDATGPHLHFELLLDNTPTDPTPYIQKLK